MAINFDHTNSASITLKGPDGSALDNYNFIFPNVTNADSSLMISGEAPISSISGLQAALNDKVDKSTTGSAALASTGFSVGNVVVLEEGGKIPSSLIPSVAIRDIYEVANTGELITLSYASIGDIGISATDHANYILCSSGANAYLDILNWKQLQFAQQIVTSVNGLHDDVILNGSNISITDGIFDGETLNYSIQYIYDNSAQKSYLTNYASTGYLNNCLNLYSTVTDVNACLSGYQTTGDFCSTISNYSTTSQISSCLSDFYVNKNATGSAATATVGTNPYNVVQLDGDAKIPASLIPKIAITDTFLVNLTGELTTLTTAEHGDIAIVTGTTPANYILAGSDPTIFEDWQALALSLGTVQSVNGVSPTEGIINITSNDIEVVDGPNFSEGLDVTASLNYLYAGFSTISGDYLTTSESTDLLNNYALTGVATGIFNTKANSVHTHIISDVNGLGDCLTSLTTFYTGAGSYSATQYGPNPLMNEAVGNYSVALGYGAKAVQDFEIAHSAGIPPWGGANVGDAQSSKLIQRCATNTSNLCEVAYICVQPCSTVLFSINIIGRAAGKYAGYKIEGSAAKDSLDSSIVLLDSNSINKYVNTSDLYYANAFANTTNGNISIKVSGDAISEMNWISDISIVKVKSN